MSTAADDVHVISDEDPVEHVLSEDCACGPTAVLTEGHAGTTWWTYEHHTSEGGGGE